MFLTEKIDHYRTFVAVFMVSLASSTAVYAAAGDHSSKYPALSTEQYRALTEQYKLNYVTAQAPQPVSPVPGPARVDEQSADESRSQDAPSAASVVFPEGMLNWLVSKAPNAQEVVAAVMPETVMPAAAVGLQGVQDVASATGGTLKKVWHWYETRGEIEKFRGLLLTSKQVDPSDVECLKRRIRTSNTPATLGRLVGIARDYLERECKDGTRTDRDLFAFIGKEDLQRQLPILERYRQQALQDLPEMKAALDALDVADNVVRFQGTVPLRPLDLETHYGALMCRDHAEELQTLLLAPCTERAGGASSHSSGSSGSSSHGAA